jgi:hypothetical protein
LTQAYFYGILVVEGREVKMKRRNIIVAISLIGAALFLFTSHVLSEDVTVTRLPEASASKPLLKEKDKDKDKAKKEESKKVSSTLKVRLILSRALPLFLARR